LTNPKMLMPEPRRLPVDIPALRIVVLHFAAISISLGTAVSALGRASLYLAALWVIIRSLGSREAGNQWHRGHWYERWDLAVLATVAYMALTIFWDSEVTAKALWSWTDHARLITLPVLWVLIKDRSEARTLVRTLVAVQLFVVLSSWMLIFDIPVPWAREVNALRDFEVFVSYLEQSIAESITAFIVWHQRDWIFGKARSRYASLVAATIVFHVVGFLPSRTGYLVATILLLVSIVLHLPRRLVWVGATVPFVLAALFMIGSDIPRNRILKVGHEFANYTEKQESISSTGVRLTFWRTSMKAIAERPLFGSGSGSWNHEYLRLMPMEVSNSGTGRDPHQMFLLWAVEGGLVGVSLLCGTLLALFWRSKALALADARSLQAALIALVVAGLTTSTIYGIGMGDFFCMVIGILLCTGKTSQSNAIGVQNARA
jgi:O-antigen ligase